MNSRFLLLLFILICLTPALAQTRTVYEGYEVKINDNYTRDQSRVMVRKGRKTLASHAEGRSGANFSQFEFLPILGKVDKQLIITQFTGGAHCCRRYWVYDLKPSFRLIFSSKDFDIGDGGDIGEGLFQNLDSDKELELADRDDAFLYFDDLAYVSSPRPLLIFDYKRKTRNFELSNKNFASYILKDIETWKKRALDVKETNPAQFEADIFSIFLDYVYAGNEKEGWKVYFGHKDSLVNGWRHNQTLVRKVLNSDRAYKWIYKK